MATQTVTTSKGKPFIFTEGYGLLPVVDATVAIALTLSKAAIRYGLKHGVAEDTERCFYALALIRDKTTGVIDARVRTNYTYVRLATNPLVWLKCSNPSEVRTFIKKFDKSNDPALAIGNVELNLAPVPPSDTQMYRAGHSGTTTKNRRPRRTVGDRHSR